MRQKEIEAMRESGVEHFAVRVSRYDVRKARLSEWGRWGFSGGIHKGWKGEVFTPAPVNGSHWHPTYISSRSVIGSWEDWQAEFAREKERREAEDADKLRAIERAKALCADLSALGITAHPGAWGGVISIPASEFEALRDAVNHSEP
jgi:hypothetical protein